jgi:hypothetical protein
MRALALCLGLGVAALGAPAYAADQVIDLSEIRGITNEALHELAEYALTRRRYTIEENTPTLIVGEQDRLKVEVIIAAPRMTIRWKEGFGHDRDLWLRSIKTDVLWRLAE